MVNYISESIKLEMSLAIKLDIKVSSKMIYFMEMEYSMRNIRIRTDKIKSTINTSKYTKEIGLSMKDTLSTINAQAQEKYILEMDIGKEISKMVKPTEKEFILAISTTKQLRESGMMAKLFLDD